MSKTDSHPTDYLVAPSLDFEGFFEKHYPELPSIEQLLKTGGYLGCCGARFTQHSTGIFQGTLFGERECELNIVWWTTRNFKNKEVVCAKAVFEKLSDTTWYLWSILFTTCDPFFFDNFTHPLGLDITAKRATFTEQGKPVLSGDLPPTEYFVFLQDKVNYHRACVLKRLAEEGVGYYDKLRDIAVTRLDRHALREILQESASRVWEAERFFHTKPVVYRDIDPNEVDQAVEDELKGLRLVSMKLETEKFGQLYMKWLDVVLDLPTNLVPSQYKGVGSRLLMTKEEIITWDGLVFLRMVSARANLIMHSPIDSSIGLGSGAACFGEVSDRDARFAEKTPKVDVKLGDVSDDWVLRVTEKLVVQQRGFLEELRALCAAGDIEGAFSKLTKGTTEPKDGQNLLGLSIALIRNCMTKTIVFPDALITKITETFEHYDMAWSFPLLPVEVNPDAMYGADLLLLLGTPVRDVA